jgi:hypothetical protein
MRHSIGLTTTNRLPLLSLFAANAISIIIANLASGVTYFATTLSMAVIPAMHEMDRRVDRRSQARRLLAESTPYMKSSAVGGHYAIMLV